MTKTGTTPEFEAKMLAIVTPLIESGAIIPRSDAPPKPFAEYRYPPEPADCGHTEIYPTGHCADCGEEVEGFEPDDVQIPGAYEIQQAAA